ncbi:MAG: dipicolinate synthase subunit B [Clostridia bacterium]|nr:dipicolinate synthase subunit B [Clostridia bacterium]
MLKDLKIGLGITGSFCNFSKIKPEIDMLKAHGINEILPIASYATLNETNRFSNPEYIKELLEKETGKEIVDTISKAEPIGPKNLVDLIVIAPCTGNTLAKLNLGITDTPVLMAVKGHIRNNKPVVIGISTNDGLGANGENLMNLLNTKNIYFIPFEQDSPDKKPKSLVYDYTKLIDTIKLALDGKQIQPLFIK